ncbi:MAG TPA: alanine--tRNA ligase [Anaerolineaceae bacterium]|nr:alanine--tRNA ligase [Anaerolineaceae bacterium]HPN53954.1 alanine--tRNA ligase [Anaerolineaceae bacterium]
MTKPTTGAEIRQSFIDFFVSKGHTFVPSASLVPGGDATLLFTNAGMVQFKDVFLGTDHRPYTRAANSQKCMRVAGKHNDLDDVGRDDTHHTFFEMLGNWSFGDYYKKEAIAWAWELLTDVWGISKELLWATYFQDDKGNIPTDEEAMNAWRAQPGFIYDHALPFGRKENFWEMADTGPCGPCSEIHIDRGIEYCDKQGESGHVCRVNGDCKRFVELWNNVFIQYNRINAAQLDPLPACHVDTGMGLERVVSVMQNVNSNYRTDLLFPLIKVVQKLTGHTDAEREANFTPYRVIADHARASSFLIADGVVPGNTGRNYICRMIIRRAARFGSKIGLHKPFLAEVAEVLIDNYSQAYPELARNRQTILDNLRREEERFARTVEAGMARLEELLDELKASGGTVLDGHKAFDLYATLGLPLELTRDVAREQNLDVDVDGFRAAMEEHRLASGAGKAFGSMGGEDVDVFRAILADLKENGSLGDQGVAYDPYHVTQVEGKVLAMLVDGQPVKQAMAGDAVELILPLSCFYVESGGQVADQGTIVSTSKPGWEIKVTELRKPAAGVIVHVGQVVFGQPHVGDMALATVDAQRRQDIMRNHTATHLLHAQLRKVLGGHAQQAGSLVSPERLRFDFNHPEAVTFEQLEQIEAGVNQAILENHALKITYKSLQQAISEGATALFGEKYGETVRTITIGGDNPFSYELCGGTHVDETGDIGLFLITSEGSAAAGVRRIEAVTGRYAYDLVQHKFRSLKQAAALLMSTPDEVPAKVQGMMDEIDGYRKQVAGLRQELAAAAFIGQIESAPLVKGVPVLAALLPQSDADTLRLMADRFRNRYPSGVVVLGSVMDGRPVIIAAVTDDLVKRGVHAGEIVKAVAQKVGGSGGGRPNMAQAGGKDPAALPEAMQQVIPLVESKLK